MSSATTCKIKSFVGGTNSLPAITVNFDCGHLMKEETSEVTCDVLSADSSGSEPSKKVVVLTRKNQLYAGVPGQRESICNTLYLIRNKRTGKAKLVSSTSCDLVNCTYRSASQHRSLTDGRNTGSSWAMLAAAFGSKRSKRRSELAQKMMLTNASQSSVLEETLAHVNKSVEVGSELSNDESLVQKLLPPCNREATCIEDVYSVDQLLTKKELEELRGLAEVYRSQPQDVESDSSFLVLPFFKSLGGCRTLTQVQLLLYANALLNFTRLSLNDIAAKNAVEMICKHPRIIGVKILNDFTELTGSNRRVRSPGLTDRAYCHAIVAILLACNYRFNANWFFSCLKGCKKSKLQPLLRVVGLVPVLRGAKNGDYTHTFKLPLPPVTLPSFKRGKK